MNIYERETWAIKARGFAKRDFTFNQKIAYLTKEFLEKPQISCPLEHIFVDGHYIREIRIPADTLFIGRPHRHGHLCELVAGAVLHITPYGRFERSAPYSLRTLAGYQVVLYAMSDVVGRTTHPDSGERNIEKLEDEIFESVESIKELGFAVERSLLEANL